jgi:DNA ligase (NAD+)
MKFIFTGFRDKEIEKLITENGGEISSSVSKNTNVLFCKDEDLNEGTNSKLIKAKELGILIVKKSDMKKFLNNLGLVFNAIMDI